MDQSDVPLIVSTGRFEQKSGRWRISRSSHELPMLEHGQQLVLVDRTGNGCLAGPTTGGERAYAGYTGWVVVDARPREITLEYEDLFETAHAKYVISVDLRAKVSDAVDAAMEGVTSLISSVRPLLAASISNSLREMETPRGNLADPVAQVRAIGERQLHADLVGSQVTGAPDWLSLKVVHLVVRNDSATDEYLRQIRGKRNDKELTTAEGVIQLTRTEYELKRREMFREALSPYMNDGTLAILEGIWENPTQEHIAAAAAKIEAKEGNERAYHLAILNAIKDNDVVADDEGLLRLARQFIDIGKQSAISDGGPEAVHTVDRDLSEEEMVSVPEEQHAAEDSSIEDADFS
ncbi:hypothetical protein F1D05_36630 [Kribbella qitaiheensis]|uniref:Uncharacterized protein n=1 Tax=Kribbella qitaiheensis TaxID=1544730 RepID=A0A7G6X854_9ACTN|nr:hypothetical protein [Kribbella qitaiheensis]QNE22419.1 hypothetical protein F1D05_36630 [Kribbella qitaiheensis]